MRRPVPPEAERQFGVFTSAQAVAAGWTSHALRHAVAHGYLVRIRVGVYADPGTPAENRFVEQIRHLRREAAAFSLTNSAVPVSHSTAGAVLGLELVNPLPSVCATFSRGRRGPMPGVHRHRGRLTAGDVGRCGHVLVTSPARTALDIGHELGPDAAIAAADSALRRHLTTRRALDTVIHSSRNWPGIALTHRALELADGCAESALESISRLRMANAGLPPPRPQVPILAHDDRFIGRVDFYWDEFGVIGEADGDGKLGGRPRGLIEEKRRQGRLEDAGLVVVRWGWSDLRTFAPVAAQLRAAFDRGVRPNRAPRLWRAEAWPQVSAAS